MVKYVLRIVANNEEVADFYRNHSHYNEGDSGLDLFCAEDVSFLYGDTKKIKFNISCEMICIDGDNTYNVSYLLLPRSSIVKTNLRMSNSVGLIDAFYRGNIMAYCDNIKNTNYAYEVKKKTRLFQICSPTLTPIDHIEVVKEFLTNKKRGGGFGSTGK